MGRWAFDLGEVRCPVAVWLGEQEAHVVERASWFTSRLTNATAHVMPDRGHFITFDDWDLILDSLAAGRGE
jgi:pimeloyl-ACP methyl ester carboxylesterase